MQFLRLKPYETALFSRTEGSPTTAKKQQNASDFRLRILQDLQASREPTGFSNKSNVFFKNGSGQGRFPVLLQADSEKKFQHV
jgi:hypothetical protein